jgi:hypothetical protein
MSVLSYRARSFIRHNLTWHNIRFQWTIVGIFLGTLAICGFNGFNHPFLRCISAGLPGYIGAQFLYAAVKFPLPSNELVYVQLYDSLKRWWSDATRPGYYAIPESGGSIKIIRHIFCGFSEIYGLNGDLIGHEQDIWNDGDWTFKPVDVGSQERMAPIAFWRTRRRKPVGMR